MAAIINFILFLLKLFPQICQALRKGIVKLRTICKCLSKQSFHPESFVKKLLALYDYEHLPHEKFINYQNGLCKKLYQNEILQIKIQYKGRSETKSLPYKEIINYTKHPNFSIEFDQTLWGPRFQLPSELATATKQILKDFKRDYPDTEDNPAVGIHHLEPLQGNKYKCQLKKLTYFDAVRTNQTLDTPLDLPMLQTTMRQKDSDMNGDLKPFSQSLLANQIGVSAVWYMNCPQKSYKDRLQFFLKSRRSKLGIFMDMMGSICGTAQPPQGGFSNFNYLEDYVESEILRIFNQTTNIDKYIDAHEIEVVRLSFARELMRGGLPQFFFLIKTPYISDKKFFKHFKDSNASRKKYHNRLLSNALTPNIAPSIVVNFLFAFRHLQRDQHWDYINLDD